MSKLSKFLATLMFVMMFSTSSALAGTYNIGIIGNAASFDTDGSEEDPTDGELNRTSVSEDVDFPSLFIEVNSPQTSWGFSLTAGLEYIPGEAELGAKSRTDTTTDANEDDQDDSTYTAKAQVSDHWGLYVEPTYNVDNFGLYLKAGVSQVTIESLESITSGTDSSAYGNEDVHGIMHGIGIKGTHDSGMFYKLEYTMINYEPVTLQSTTGNKNKIKADTESESVRFAIGYSF